MKQALDRVLFDKPVCFQIDAPPDPNAQPSNLSHAEVQKFCKLYRDEGYADRAVVAEADKFSYYYEQPKNWGVVIDLQTYVPMNRPYKPLKVMWMDGRPVSEHWPEELVFIHRAITPSAIAWAVKESE